MNETICCSTKHKCLMELQFSDCKLNPSSENEPHLIIFAKGCKLQSYYVKRCACFASSIYSQVYCKYFSTLGNIIIFKQRVNHFASYAEQSSTAYLQPTK